MIKPSEKIITHRVITMLCRSEVDFLDKLGKDALFTTGHKLSYNEILRGLIDFAMELRVSGEKIRSADELKESLLHLINKATAKH
jgi:hypothetical protein